MYPVPRKRNPPPLREVYKFFVFHFSKHGWMVFWAFFLIFLSAVTNVAMPQIHGWLVDVLAQSIDGARDFSAILEPIIAMTVLSALYHLTMRGAHFINCYTNPRVHAAIAADSVKYVHSFETEWHTNTFAGSIVTAIKRGRSAVQRTFDTVCYDFWPTLVIVIGSIAFAWERSPWIAVSLIVYAASFGVFSVGLSLKYLSPKNRIYADEDSRLGGTIADSVTGYAAVKASGAERHEFERITHAANRFADAARIAWIRANILSLSQNVIINLGRFAAMFLAAYYWSTGFFTPGDVMFVLMTQRIIANQLDGIGNRLRDIIESINDLEEVVSWRNRKPRIANLGKIAANDCDDFTLKFDNVTFQYEGQHRPAIKGFNLTIEPGEKVALVGRTGSGKSTLFKLLHHYYKPQQGIITIDGFDIADMELSGLRRQLALVSQEPVLFHRTLAENIAYSRPDATMEEIKAAADRAQIGDLIETLPKGYQTLVGERGIKLSGGERQRVAIARALLADSRIILLDEATSSLDNETEHLVQAALDELTVGRSVLAIAHRVSTIQDFDRIIVMEHGKIVETGTHDDLLARNGYYTKLCQHITAAAG